MGGPGRPRRGVAAASALAGVGVLAMTTSTVSAYGGFSGSVTSASSFTAGTHLLSDTIAGQTCLSSANAAGAIGATNSALCPAAALPAAPGSQTDTLASQGSISPTSLSGAVSACSIQSYPDSSSSTTFPDSTGGNTATVAGTVTSSSGPSAFTDSPTSATFDGTSGNLTTTSNISAPETYSIGVWFKTSSSNRSILGFSNSQTTTSPSDWDRMLWIDSAGHVVFGTYPGSMFEVNSSSTTAHNYADGAWHYAVVTNQVVSPSKGTIELYLDGALVAGSASNESLYNSADTGFPYSGYWHLGYQYTSSWTDGPSSYYFSGSLADAAIFPTALSAAQVTTLSALTSQSSFAVQTQADAPTYFWPLQSGGNPALPSGSIGSTTGPVTSSVASTLDGTSSSVQTSSAVSGPQTFSVGGWVKSSTGNASIGSFSTAQGENKFTTAVGTTPGGAALTPSGAYLYVPNYGSNTVSVIATGTGTLVTTISVGTRPMFAAAAPNGNTVYVSNSGSTSVSVISTATNTVTATISVGSQPQGMVVSPDSSTLYVANYGANTISVIATSTNTVTATWGGGNSPSQLTLNAAGTTLYAPGSTYHLLIGITTSTGATAGTATTGTYPRGVAISPSGTTLYAANTSSGTISVITASTYATSATITITGGVASGQIAMSPDGTVLYVPTGANTIAEVSTATNTVVATIPLPSGAGAASATLSPDGTTLYVSAATTGKILAVPVGNQDRALWFDASGHIDAELSPSLASPFEISSSSTTATNFADGNWHHVMLTVTPTSTTTGTVKLYVDGTLVAGASANETISASTTAGAYTGYWHLGFGDESIQANAPGSDFLAGALADWAVFPSALSAAQITTLAGASTQSSLASALTTDTPTSLWTMQSTSTYAGQIGGVNPCADEGLTVFDGTNCLLPAQSSSCPSSGTALSSGATFTPIASRLALTMTTMTLGSPPSAAAKVHLSTTVTFASNAGGFTASLAHSSVSTLS